MDINLSSQIVVQTAAQWAIDATVYSNKRILVTSDVYYGSTDQRKFKIADGTQTWAQLDYMPISQTLAQVLANGSSTGGTSFKSPNSLTELLVANNNIDLYVDNSSDVSEINMTPTTINISTTGTGIDLTATSVTKNTKEILTEDNITQTITNGVTDKAPSEDAVFDALALKANLTDSRFGSTNHCSGAVVNLLPSANYYFGMNPTLSVGTATIARVFCFMNTGTVTKVSFTISLTGTVGSSQACDVYLRNVTAGTETLLGQVTYDQGSSTTTNYLWTPSISVPNTTDFWTVKIATGAFTTNPTSVYHNARIFNQV